MPKSLSTKLVVFGDPHRARVAEAIEEFIDFAKDKAQITASCSIEKCSTEMLEEADFAVVFGGDGTILAAARILCRSDVPVIGVNLGKLGFLAEFSLGELKQHLGDIIARKARIEKRMMLDCRVLRSGKERFGSTAVNDVFITSGPPFRMIELRITVDSQPLARCVSDGLIISTPTGSTAYNLSAGGPILSGDMEAMVITPICPHSLSFRPIVISAAGKVQVIGVRLNEGSTVSIDGQAWCSLMADDVVSVEKDKCEFRVVNNPVRTQWDALATKLHWADRPRYNIT